MMNSTKPILDIRHLGKAFGSTQVLSDISLSLHRGEIIFLLGASGCGKTTLLRTIAGFEQPDRGEIWLNDRLIANDQVHTPTQQRRFGYVVQEGVLFPHLNVYRNIAYGLGNGKGKTETERARIEAVMDLTGIRSLANRMPHELSGGQQQRVALARALAPQPDIILLDEPFSALDEHLRQQIRQEMLTALKASGTSAVFVTHDRDEALRFGDKIAVMQQGKILQFAAPDILYWQADNLATAQFLGESILLPAQTDHSGEWAECAFGKIPVQPSQKQQQGNILLRPEQFSLFANSAQKPSACLTAEILEQRSNGRYDEMLLQIANKTLTLFNHYHSPIRSENRQLPLFLFGQGRFFADEQAV